MCCSGNVQFADYDWLKGSPHYRASNPEEEVESKLSDEEKGRGKSEFPAGKEKNRKKEP